MANFCTCWQVFQEVIYLFFCSEGDPGCVRWQVHDPS